MILWVYLESGPRLLVIVEAPNSLGLKRELGDDSRRSPAKPVHEYDCNDSPLHPQQPYR